MDEISGTRIAILILITVIGLYGLWLKKKEEKEEQDKKNKTRKNRTRKNSIRYVRIRRVRIRHNRVRKDKSNQPVLVNDPAR